MLTHPVGPSMSAPLILRRAEPEDSGDLLAWRNDPESVRNSKSPTPVALGEHARWFAASLTNPDRRIYIGLVGDEKIGMVRFDRLARSEPAYLVSITINPACRGRRLGTRLLLAALRQAAPATFDAEIRTENVISQRLFEACGFRRVGPSADIVLDLYRAAVPE